MTVSKHYVRLAPWEECDGLCKKVEVIDGYLVANIGEISLALHFEMEQQLKELEGKRIGILRTDTDYRVRVLG